MSLRLRLGLWYGALTGLVILVISVFTYATHTRGHYDDMDYTLQATAEHMVQEYEAGKSLPTPPVGSIAPISQSLAISLYDVSGAVIAQSPSAGLAQAPSMDPRAVLAHPAGPAFDPVAGIAPSFAAPGPGGGSFGLTAQSDGIRWRSYVLPFHQQRYFLVVEASLDRIDASVAQFRALVVLLSVAGAVVALLAGWLLARRALRPVAMLTETAGSIARSRGFSRRVPIGPAQDELGRLATTFNDMLGSLEQAYRAQQRFVADASHELRAPLTAIQGNLDLLERLPDMPPDERQVAVTEASREAHRLARLVADLLALARADAGVSTRHDRVELDRVLLEALGDARHLLHGQALEVDELEPAIVMGDPDRLKQLLLILLDNAIKYTPPAGKVTVGLRHAGKYMEVTVRDSGIGISPQDLPYVFDRFYRADPARGRDPGGTGLGLAIARWITEQQSGDIMLKSEPGRGTTATVRLPLL